VDNDVFLFAQQAQLAENSRKVRQQCPMWMFAFRLEKYERLQKTC
jgi:hypothetical protein